MKTIRNRTACLTVSKIALGTWALGGWMWSGSVPGGVLAASPPAPVTVADVETGRPMAIRTPVPEIPPVRPSAPAANLGPVTGYGPGGMAAMPGAPANPPYSPGCFGGRR